MASFVVALMLVASAAEANTRRGHEEYLRYCSACHGAEADGKGHHGKTPQGLGAGPDSAYDGEGLGKGGTATLSVDGEQIGQGRIEKAQPLIFSADETADVGLDNQTPVAEGIGIGRDETRFSGKTEQVEIEVR